jgi:hypothetical protein
MRKDHAQCDDEEHHAAGHAERRLLESEVMHDLVAPEQEGDQHQIGDDQLARNDPEATGARIRAQQ